MTGKVGQICRREDLHRMSGQICGWGSWIRRARKLDEKEDMNELIAEWKEGMQIRKTDIEETEATTRRSAGNHYPRPKITVTQRCRAENVQLGKE